MQNFAPANDNFTTEQLAQVFSNLMIALNEEPEETAVAKQAENSQADIEASKSNSFIVGETYSCRSACNYDTVYSWTVVRRTEKSIWIKDKFESEPSRVKIQKNDDGESAFPDGRYSMCPVIRA